MSFRVQKSEDMTNAASANVASPKTPSVRITNTTAATIATAKFGESDAVVAAAGDTAIPPGQSFLMACPAGATHLAILCANGRVNLAWGEDGHG